nr:PaaI family thioesterase [Veillonella denticariosi]
MATSLLEYFNELREQNPFSWVKDSEVTAVEAGHIEMTLQTNATEYCNFRGHLHGAVCIGFADSLMGSSCFTLGKSVSTIDINGNYVKAVTGGTLLRGVANVEHNGKTTMVATARIYNELGELVHLARGGTFYVLEEKPLPDLPWRFIEEDNPDLV